MKHFLKSYWKTLLFFTLVSLFGGFFAGLFVLDSYPAEIVQDIYDQGITDALMGIITAAQYAGYGLFLGAIGIWLGKKIGLWKEETAITRKPLTSAVIISVVGGLCLILPDILFFGKYSEAIMDSYAAKPTVPYLLATVTLGAVTEEVMLRLFMMSLIAFILHKLFDKNRELPSPAILMIANLITAILFAAGHLPVTFLTLGSSPMILFRCFLLNGCFGLAFGWLYRKFGLRYAMIAHGGCHVVSKLIWILFI